MSVGPPPYRTMHEHVLDRIGLEIVAGVPPAGGALDPEHILAERLGVSRGAIREAAKALAAKGMVELRPRTGTRVLQQSSWNLLDRRVLSWMQQVEPESLTVHLTEVRRLIEPAAARLAAERATAAETDVLISAYRDMEQAHQRGDSVGFTTADIEFHHVLLRLTHNPLLAALNSSLEVALQATFETSSRAPGAVSATLPLHLAVAEAVAAHQPDRAHAEMEAMINTSARDFAEARQVRPNRDTARTRKRTTRQPATG